MTPEPIKTEQHGREWPAGWADDGYEWMEQASEDGWHPVASWGRDGWDLGSWPYVCYVFRTRKDPSHDSSRCDPICVLAAESGSDFCPTLYERACYCEGDVTVETFASREDREAATDETAAWYWRSGQADGPDDLPPEGEPLPPHACGPFSWKRLDAEEAAAE